MKKFAVSLLIALLMFSITGCGSSSSSEQASTNNEASNFDMQLKINDETLNVTWEDNESVNALKNIVQSENLTIKMSRYGGFEQVGSIGQSIPRNDVQTTTGPGDIVLYNGNQIVIFYGSNSWAYTRLGKVTGKTPDELANILGASDVTLTLSTEN